jgi:hypothetical protein
MDREFRNVPRACLAVHHEARLRVVREIRLRKKIFRRPMTIACRMSFPGHRGVTFEATMPMLTVRRRADGRGWMATRNCVTGP